MVLKIILFILLVCCQVFCGSPWLVNAGLTASHFQQQVKVKQGGPRGDRLVNELQIGTALYSGYRVSQHISLGLFFNYDWGTRESGLFTGFDSEDMAVTDPVLGGTYHEFWVGPRVQAAWKMLRADIGYAALGYREDEGRSDVLSETGSSTGYFKTSPTVAYLAALGADVPVTPGLGVTFKLEYRVRYYNQRGGKALQNKMEHGTMSLSPLIGIAWNI